MQDTGMCRGRKITMLQGSQTSEDIEQTSGTEEGEKKRVSLKRRDVMS